MTVWETRYNDHLRWRDLCNKLEQTGSVLIDAVNRAHETYKDFLEYRNGRTDAAIATALDANEVANGVTAGSVTEAMVTELRVAVAALDDIVTYCESTGTPPAFDKLRAFKL